MEDDIFRQKGAGVARGNGSTAEDATPSEYSGGQQEVKVPVWKSFVGNKQFQKDNAAAIDIEQSVIRQSQRKAPAPPRETWGGDNGRLIRKVGNQIEQFDAEQFADDPKVGIFARKSLFDKERRRVGAELDEYELSLTNPAFKARELAKKDRENHLMELEVLPDGDARKEVARKRLADDEAYRAEKSQLEQKRYEAKARAVRMGNMDPDSWWQNRSAPTPVDPVATAQAARAEADAADESAVEREKEIDRELMAGVRPDRLAALQAEKAEITQARLLAGEQKAGAAAEIEGVKQAAKQEIENPENRGFLNNTVAALQRGYASAAQASNILQGATDDTNADDIVRYEKMKQANPASKEFQDFMTAEGFANSAKAFIKNPVRIITEVLAESAAQMVPSIALGSAAGAIGGAVSSTPTGGAAAPATIPIGAAIGGAIGVGTGSALVEYGGAMMQSMQDAGMDATSPESIKSFFSDPEKLAVAREFAIKRGVAIGAFDAVSAGLAGKFLKPVQTLVKGGQKAGAGKILSATAGEVALQAGIGAGGDGAAQLLSEGKISDGKSMFLEGIAEIGTGPFEVATNLREYGKTPADAEKVVSATSTAIRAIDPEAPAPTTTEIDRAKMLVNPNDGVEGLAESVLLERELAQVSVEDDARLASATEAVEAAKASGDSAAIEAAESARAGIQGRAENVRAVVKIAAGQSPADLTSAELKSLGFKRGNDGSIDAMTDEELSSVGLDDTLMTLGEDGSLILTDAALKRVEAISPRARGRIKLTEAEAIAKARERAVTSTWNVSTRDGGTVSIRAATAEDAEREVAGSGVSIQPGSAVQISQSGVPTPTGSPGNTAPQGTPAALAEGEQSLTTQTNEQGQTQGTDQPQVSLPSMPTGTDALADGGAGRSTPQRTQPSEAQSQSEVEQSPATTGVPTDSLPDGQGVTPGGVGSSAVKAARARIAKITRQSPDIAAALEAGRAEATATRISIDPESSIAESLAAGLSESEALARFNASFDEEIKHFAQLRAARAKWNGVGNFDEWYQSYYGKRWQAEFSGERGVAARTIYAKGNAATEARWDSMSDANKFMEATRMMMQRRDGSMVTEQSKLWANISKSLAEDLRAMLRALREMVKSIDATPALKADIEFFENELRNILKQNQSRPRTSKASDAQPAQSEESVGTGSKTESKRDSVPSGDGRTFPASSDSVSPSLSRGQRVEFDAHDGQPAGTGVVRIANDKLVSIFPDSNPSAARSWPAGKVRSVNVNEMPVREKQTDLSITDETQTTLTPAEEKARKVIEGLFSAELPVSAFFSQLSRSIDSKMPTVATPAQIAQIAMSGAKAEEVKWSGLIPWLQGRDKVSKEEVLEYLNDEGAVRFEEVNLAGKPTPLSRDQFDALPEAEQERLANATDRTKFAQYTLPGGKNYREVVLAMPRPQGNESDARQLYSQQWRSGEPIWESLSDAEKAKWVGRVAPKGEYTSSHFPDVPNYVAHMRTNERDGGLFIEELQSDRHQAGRKKGYREELNVTEADLEKEGLRMTQNDDGEFVIRDEFNNVFGYGFTKQAALETIKQNREKAANAVADAPHRKDWPLALFKRALRDAVASGKEWIGWTTGETQNDRFDLSKQVDSVSVTEWPAAGPGMVVLTATKNGSQVIKETIPEAKIEDYIGKDVARKLMEQPAEMGSRELSGDNLKVGGSGMKGFYDNILPKEIGKYVKQWGGKVEQSQIDGDPIWRINITTDMRKGVSEGQSLFSAELPSPSYTLSIPQDRFMALMDAAQSLAQDGVNTPEALAETMKKLAPDNKAVPFTQSFWFALKAVGIEGAAEPDWAFIYSSKTQSLGNEIGLRVDEDAVAGDSDVVEEAAEALKPNKKAPRKKISARYSRIQELFASNPFVASIMEQGGMMSKSRARKEMGESWWAENGSQYDDAPTFKNPTFNAIYSKSGRLTPNKIAEGIADDGLMQTGDVNRMWKEVQKAADSTTNQNKATTKEIEKNAIASKQAEAFAEKNQERIGSIGLQVGDFEVGSEILIDGVSLTIESNDGETVILSDGEQYGKQSLSVEDAVWPDIDDGPFFGEEDIEAEANQIVDEAEKQGYSSPDDFIANQQESDSATNAEDGSIAGSENGSVPPQNGKSQVKPTTSKMDVKNADSRELFADDGGFSLVQQGTQDGDKIAAERKAKEDAKAAMDAAQGDMFGASPATNSSPAPIVTLLNEQIEYQRKVYGNLTEGRVNSAITDAASSLMGDKNAEKRQDAIEFLTGERPPKSKAGIDRVAAALKVWTKENPVAKTAQETPPASAGRIEDFGEKITTLDSLMAFFQRIRSGDTTAAEIKAQWEAFKTVELDITKEVMKMTMKELERFQGMRKPDNKAEAVRMAMDALHGEFRPGAMFSYGGVIGSRDKMDAAKKAAQEKAVAEWTDEIIQANAKERRDKAEARKKALENPETLDEWKQFVRRKGLTGLSPDEVKAFNAIRSPYDLEPKIMARGESRLTPEQLAAYDEVRGTDRKAEAQARKEREATVRGVKADTDSEIVETKHTKTGADLFVVRLADRVERDVYNSLNAAAKKLGGYYSSYRGGGAVPGFQFKDRATAEQFQAITKGETVERSEALQERQAEKKSATAERLTVMADRMDAAADASLNADRKTNTLKRAREAGYAEASARSLKAMATTMRNLAAAIESGEATHLDGVKTKTHVETLMRLSNRAKSDAENAENLSYSEREKRKGEPPTTAQIDKAKYPYPFLNETAWQWLIENGNNTPGAKRLVARLEKVFAAKPSVKKNGGYLVDQAGDGMISVVKELLGKINKQDYTRKNIEAAFENYDRVKAMGLTDLPMLRAALREFLQYRGTKGKADPIKEMERDLVGMKIPGFFPTPQTVIEEMLDRAGNVEGKHVLEPSAGKGDIADAARAAGADVEVIEQQSRLRDILEARGHRVIGSDFMDANPETRGFTFGDVFQNKEKTKGIMRKQGGMGSDRVRLVREDGTEIGKYDRSELEGIEKRGSNSGYDVVLMNPPFEDGQDGEHVQRAYQFLKPGGKLVAITGEGIFGRSDKKSQAFRDWLDSVGGTSEKLPEGSFKSAFRPTGVATRIVEIEKPGTSLRAADLPDAQPLIDFVKTSFAGLPSDYKFTPSNETNPNIQRIAKEQSLQIVSAENLLNFQRVFEERTGARPVFYTGGNPETKGFVEASAPSLIFVNAAPDRMESMPWILIHELIHVAQRDLDAKAKQAYDNIIDRFIDDNAYFAIQKVLLNAGYHPEEIAAEIQTHVFTDVISGASELQLENLPKYEEFKKAIFDFVNGLSGLKPLIIKPTLFSKGLRAAELPAAQDAEYLAAVERGDMETAQRMVDEAQSSALADKLLNEISNARFSPSKQTELTSDPVEFVLKGRAFRGSEMTDQEFHEMIKRRIENYQKFPEFKKRVDEEADRMRRSLAGASAPGTQVVFINKKEDRILEILGFGKRTSRREILAHELFHARANGLISHSEFMATIYGKFKAPKHSSPTLRNMLGVANAALNVPIAAIYELVTLPNRLTHIASLAYFAKSKIYTIKNKAPADPVTYDADGNVIPLSQRFNPQSPSILFTADLPSESVADVITKNFDKEPNDLKFQPYKETDEQILKYAESQGIELVRSQDLLAAQRLLKERTGASAVFFRGGDAGLTGFTPADAPSLIFVRADQSSPGLVWAVSHELTHVAQKDVEAGMRTLYDSVDAQISNKEYRLIEKLLRAAGYDERVFAEEIQAFIVSDVIGNQSVFGTKSLENYESIKSLVLDHFATLPRLNPKEQRIDGTTLQAADLPTPAAKKARDAFNANRKKFEQAQAQLRDFGTGSVGADPKFANQGTTPAARDQLDIARMIDSHQREVRKDRDTHSRGREYLEKYPDAVEKLLIERAYGENPEPIADYQQHAINLLLDRKAQQAVTKEDFENLAAIATANVINGREMARAFRQRMDRFATPEERARSAIADAIFTPTKRVAARAEVMAPKARKEFLAEYGKSRIAEIEKELAKRGIRIEQILGKNRDLQLANSKLQKDMMQLRNALEQDIIRFVQKGASLADIRRRFGKLGAEQAEGIITKARQDLFNRIKAMADKGMDRAAIIEAMKDTLKAAPLSRPKASMTEAEIWNMIDKDFGIPAASAIPKQALPRVKKIKIESEIETHPLSANWSRPEFYEGMKSYTFDLKDRSGIMERVEIIRGLAGAMGKIDSLTGEKRAKAEAQIKEIDQILSKYGTDAKGIFNSSKGIEDYHFDINDIAQVALVARTINAMDADFIDKATEYLYASMLSGLQTMIVNLTAIVPAAWEATVGRGVNMAINQFVKDPMAEQYGEGKYIVRALGPALSRAKSNFVASMAAQHPMFDRDVNAMEIDWDKILGGGSHRMIGSIKGRKGDIIRLPMRVLTATDDFNRTLIACAEVGTFAYRMAKMQGMKDGSPEMDKFILSEVNTPGSVSFQLASRKASQAIYTNPLPGQADPHTGKTVPVKDMGDFVGFIASKITDTVSKDHDNIFIKTLSAALRVSFFPFQRTPFNIIRKGVRHTLNPFSLADIALGVVRNAKNEQGKWEWAIKGNDQAAMNRHLQRAELIERMGQQLQGAVLMTALYALALGEGDEDDQDKSFIITGSSPFLPTGRGEREARMRSGVGPFRLSWRNKDGSERIGFSYGRIEPVATILSATIDIMKSAKRERRAGKDNYDATMAAIGGLVSQAQDKSFMRGISDFIGLSSSVMTSPDLRENRKALQFLAGRTAMVVPNIIKQPIREADPVFRERSEGFMQELLYQSVPYGQKPAKIDPYGQTATKPGIAPIRAIDMGDTGTTKVNSYDSALLKWSDKHPDKAWFPSPIVNGSFKNLLTKEEVDMNQAQLSEFREIAGKRVLAKLKLSPVNLINPTVIDIEKIKKAHSEARSEAKKMIAIKYSRP